MGYGLCVASYLHTLFLRVFVLDPTSPPVAVTKQKHRTKHLAQQVTINGVNYCEVGALTGGEVGYLVPKTFVLVRWQEEGLYPVLIEKCLVDASLSPKLYVTVMESIRKYKKLLRNVPFEDHSLVETSEKVIVDVDVVVSQCTVVYNSKTYNSLRPHFPIVPVGTRIDQAWPVLESSALGPLYVCSHSYQAEEDELEPVVLTRHRCANSLLYGASSEALPGKVLGSCSILF